MRRHPHVEVDVRVSEQYLDLVSAGIDAAIRIAKRCVTSDEMTFVQSAIVQGIGLGVLPMFLADADVRQGRLLQVLPGLALFSGTIWFLAPPPHRKTARALDALRDCITEVLVARGLV